MTMATDAVVPDPKAFLGCGLLVSVVGWILVRQSQSPRQP